MSENNKKEGFVKKGIKQIRKKYQKITSSKKIYFEDQPPTEKARLLDSYFPAERVTLNVPDKYGNCSKQINTLASMRYPEHLRNKSLGKYPRVNVADPEGLDSEMEGEWEVREEGLTEPWNKLRYYCLGWALGDALGELARRCCVSTPKKPVPDKEKAVKTVENDLINSLKLVGCTASDFDEKELESMEKEVNESGGLKYLIAMRTGYGYKRTSGWDGYGKENEGQYVMDFHFAKFAYKQGWTHKMNNGELYYLDHYSESIWKYRNYADYRTQIQKETHKVAKPRVNTLEVALTMEPIPKLLSVVIQPKYKMVRMRFADNSLFYGVLKDCGKFKENTILYTAEGKEIEPLLGTTIKSTLCFDISLVFDYCITPTKLVWIPKDSKGKSEELFMDISYNNPYLSGIITDNGPVDTMWVPTTLPGKSPWCRGSTLKYLNVRTNGNELITNVRASDIPNLLKEVVEQKLPCSTYFILNQKNPEVLKFGFDTTKCLNNIFDCFHYDSPTKFLLVSLTDEKKLQEVSERKYKKRMIETINEINEKNEKNEKNITEGRKKE